MQLDELRRMEHDTTVARLNRRIKSMFTYHCQAGSVLSRTLVSESDHIVASNTSLDAARRAKSFDV